MQEERERVRSVIEELRLKLNKKEEEEAMLSIKIEQVEGQVRLVHQSFGRTLRPLTSNEMAFSFDFK